MKLPSWFTPKKTAAPPTLAELRDRVEQAESEHAAAVDAQRQADERCASERSPEAFEASDEAERETRRLAKMLSIVKADVERAEQAELDQRRAELERQRQAIGVELDALRERARGAAVESEVAALIAVVDTRLARWTLCDEIAAKHRELARIDVELGDEPRPYQLEAPHGVTVSERLESMADTLQAGDPRRLLLRALRPGRDDYHRTGPMGPPARTAEAAE